jgi:hypothetical protein
MRILSKIKNLIVPQGSAPREILWGAMSGIKMQIDLRYDTQAFLGLQEREIQGWLQSFSRDIATALDIGTAAGEVSLFFLKKTLASRVFAFEPDLKGLERFDANLALNGLRGDARLTIINKCVGRNDSPQFVALDSLAQEIETPGVVKIDVDGAETDVLSGAEQILRKPCVRWIVETHTSSLEAECLRIFRRSGYAVRVVDKAWWRIAIPEMRYAAHRPENHNRWFVAAREEDIRL